MIYEIDYQKQQLTFCQAPLGALAAIQLLDWLISYGVKEVIAIGNAGALIDIDENWFLIRLFVMRERLLFTADTLANESNYDERNWGN